jgi:hypothetical protein
VAETVEREGKKNGRKNRGRKLVFFIFFSPNFLLIPIMKSISIYRGWKRDVLSPLMPNLGPWFDPERSHPLVSRTYHRLSVLLQEKSWSS